MLPKTVGKFVKRSLSVFAAKYIEFQDIFVSGKKKELFVFLGISPCLRPRQKRTVISSVKKACKD